MRLTLLECAQALKLRPPLGCEEREIAGAAIDSRQVKPGDLFFCLPGERVDGHDYAMKAAEKGCSAIIASRPVEAGGKPVLMAPDTEAALGILARLWREKTGVKTLCLTGTAGKTTLKECLAAIMSKAGKVAATQGNHNNQIGLPLTILNASGDENCWILEAGISHTGDMDYLGGIALPDMALILNVGAGHEEGLGEKGVAWHKTRLLNYVSSNGCSLVNADYPELLEAARNTGRKLILFGSRPGSGEDLQYVLVKSEANGSHTVKCPQGLYTFKTPFRAAYGGELTVAAVAAALSLGAGPEEIAAGFAAVKLPEQRFRRIQVGETLIFDDTYNANPLSMRRMLEAASSAAKEAGLPFYAMLGEMGELGKESSACHRSLGEHLAELGPKAVIWHGGYANDVLAGLAGQSPFIKVNSAEDFLKAWDEAALGDAACVVLFKGSRFNHLENHLAAFKSMLNAKGSHCVL